MPRIRTVKPEFWQDERIAELSRDARLLYIATWNFADDEGLIRWTPEFIKAQAFPYDADMTLRKVRALMTELVESDLVFAYSSGKPPRQELAFIIRFRKHQRIDKPQPSKLPPPSIQLARVKAMYGRRDEMVCHLCKSAIEEVTDEPHNPYDHEPGNRYWEQKYQQLSLDHLKPRVDGGTDYPSNLRASHVSCNLGRGRRPLPDDSPTNSPTDSRNGSWNGSVPEVEVEVEVDPGSGSRASDLTANALAFDSASRATGSAKAIEQAEIDDEALREVENRRRIAEGLPPRSDRNGKPESIGDLIRQDVAR